jgi:site-specific recombinase XerD
MLKRRLVCAGYGTRETKVTAAGHKYTIYRSLYSPHSFRVTVLTDLISQGEDIQDVAYLAGHSSTRTTQGYDRTKRAVKRNLVERIRVELD